MYYQTNRTYTNVETNISFALHMDSDTHDTKLIDDKDNEVKGFYICAFTGCSIKVNGDRLINLPMGTFYELKKGERVTHRKFIGFSKFSRI